MSQQKILLAVCAFGAVVALASAQLNFNMEGCQRNARAALDEFTNTLRSSAQKFADNMQAHGESATDTSVFQDDIDRMVSSINKLLQNGANFDPSTLSATYLENASTVAKMMRTAFALYMRMPSDGFGSYLEFSGSAVNAQRKLMESIAAACAGQ